jgi:glutaredoxin 3
MAKRVEVYSSMLCPYCFRAKKLLESKGVAFEEIDIMLRPGARKEMIQRSGGRTSVPQVFVDGRLVGNCDELFDLEDAGRLDAILQGGADA